MLWLVAMSRAVRTFLTGYGPATAGPKQETGLSREDL
jgi:hypothetical protein